MPSGRYVKTDIYRWGMSVYAYALGLDYKRTEGLCGSFDSNPSNDIDNSTGDFSEFLEKWR